jgi:hypothetical protein
LTLETVRARILPLVAAGLMTLLLLWLALTPAEERLGGLIRLVFVHGALVWVGLITFSVAGVLGLLALVVRRRCLYQGADSAGLAALVVWVAYVVSAMIVTGLTWGQLIAWNEPRVRATALILMAAVVLFIVARPISLRRSTS